METVCIYEESDYINTLSVKELLDSSGIITHMPNEHLGGIFPGAGMAYGTYRIFVPEDQAEEALEILKGHLFIDDDESMEDNQTRTDKAIYNQPMDYSPQTIVLNGEDIIKPLVCPKCGSENIATSQIPRVLFFVLSSLIVGGALPSHKEKKRCKSCKHRWI